MNGPRTRLRKNVTSVTALLVVGIGLTALALRVPNFWVIFAVGLGVVVPLVGLLFGADDWRKWDPFSDEFWEDAFGENESESEDTLPGDDSQASPDDRTSKQDALETLRERYALGELTDEQFERKLERLVETESVEAVEDRYADRDREMEPITETE